MSTKCLHCEAPAVTQYAVHSIHGISGETPLCETHAIKKHNELEKAVCNGAIFAFWFINWSPPKASQGENRTRSFEIFTVGQTTFRAEFTPAPLDRQPARWDNQWILYKFTFHKSTPLRKLQRPRAQQIPRLKRIGVFDTLDQCKVAAKKAAA